jgi:hypothetical protein
LTVLAGLQQIIKKTLSILTEFSTVLTTISYGVGKQISEEFIPANSRKQQMLLMRRNTPSTIEGFFPPLFK